MNHFEEQHSAVKEKGGHIDVWHAGFIITIESSKSRKWNPVLLHVNEDWCKNSVFVITGNVDARRQVCTWTCVRICNPEEADVDNFALKVKFSPKGSDGGYSKVPNFTVFNELSPNNSLSIFT